MGRCLHWSLTSEGGNKALYSTVKPGAESNVAEYGLVVYSVGRAKGEHF